MCLRDYMQKNIHPEAAVDLVNYVSIPVVKLV